MRLPNSEHLSRAWRIREIAPDFIVEDVWALPAHGSAADFPRLPEAMRSIDVATMGPLPVRVVWSVRDRLGRYFDLGRITRSDEGTNVPEARLPIPGTNETSLFDRLPDDLRGTAAHLPDDPPFTPMYLTDVEYAAEMSNRTVHAVMHLGWVDRGDGQYQGQLAVYVKPRGGLGEAYMGFIKPFRYVLVYPALMGMIEQAWNRTASPAEEAPDEPRISESLSERITA